MLIDAQYGFVVIGYSTQTNPNTHMKNPIAFSAAAITVLCCLYLSIPSNVVETTRTSNLTEAPPESALPIADVNSSQTELPQFTELKTKKTVRRFANDETQTIECRAGTKLFFPAGSFVYPSGKPFAGEVRLVVEECYDLEEILAAKLSTTSGIRRLETAGMINLRAYADNTELKLADNARYNVYFPARDNGKEDFELFYGYRKDDGLIDWKLEEDSEPISEAAAPSKSIRNDCFVQISASQLRCGNRIREMDYFNWPLQNGQNLNQWFVSNFNPDPAMLDDFCARRMYSQITFHINEDGTFNDYYISHSSLEQYDRLLAGMLQSMPALDMEMFMPQFTEDHACILSFGRQQETSSKKFVERFKKRFDYADANRTLEDVATEDLNYYIFSSTELGWINCDRFLPEEGQLVDLAVEVPACENASVSMVFDKDRSIVAGIKQGNEFVFKNIPANRNVRVITIDNPSGKPHMEHTKLNTSNRKCIVRNLEPITLSDLDDALCWN
ncbi:MAG: hypothetical protein RL040_590 [Bacteroidota bacterium]